jgi:predicted nucleic acid-binding protein
VKFWDSSAVVPLVITETGSERLLELLARDPAMVVWWATVVEVASALARREREGALPAGRMKAALDRLRALAAAWSEVLPVDVVRSTAQRLLRVHPLRAADALQIAAAIVAADHQPSSMEIVTLDDRLREAAEREGFAVARA